MEIVNAGCDQLQSLNMINISDTTRGAWFLEFKRLGWSKSYFVQRLNAVKKLKIFGGITLNDWLTGEVFYTEKEVELMLMDRIKAMLMQGRILSERTGISFNHEEKKLIDLYAADQYQKECIRNRSIAFNDEIEFQKEAKRIINKGKAEALKKLSLDQLKNLILDAVREGYLIAKDDNDVKNFVSYYKFITDKLPLNFILSHVENC